MRRRVTEALARLASASFAERYIVGGSSDEYAVPEEVVDSACSEAESALRTPIGNKSFSTEELAALAEFVRLARELQVRLPFEDDTITNEALVNLEAWTDLRAAALKCLAAVAFDLPDWEKRVT